MLRLLPRTRRKIWIFVGVLLVSMLVLFVLARVYFDSDLYRHYKWRQFDKADRLNQHKTVVARVQAAGGWAALQRDCEALVKTNQDGEFLWYKFLDTNPLPPAIAAIQPMEVRYDSPGLLKRAGFKAQFSIVRINVFGSHRTGGRDIPFFGLEVVCGTNADGYSPLSVVVTNGEQFYTPYYANYEKMTNWIYEIH